MENKETVLSNPKLKLEIEFINIALDNAETLVLCEGRLKEEGENDERWQDSRKMTSTYLRQAFRMAVHSGNSSIEEFDNLVAACILERQRSYLTPGQVYNVLTVEKAAKHMRKYSLYAIQPYAKEFNSAQRKASASSPETKPYDVPNGRPKSLSKAEQISASESIARTQIYIATTFTEEYRNKHTLGRATRIVNKIKARNTNTTHNKTLGR